MLCVIISQSKKIKDQFFDKVFKQKFCYNFRNPYCDFKQWWIVFLRHDTSKISLMVNSKIYHLKRQRELHWSPNCWAGNELTACSKSVEKMDSVKISRQKVIRLWTLFNQLDLKFGLAGWKNWFLSVKARCCHLRTEITISVLPNVIYIRTIELRI